MASKIADRVGITRSVIVNALRKFESAGVIESRSSGMKGTYIKVLNDVIFDELDELKARKNTESDRKGRLIQQQMKRKGQKKEEKEKRRTSWSSFFFVTLHLRKDDKMEKI